MEWRPVKNYEGIYEVSEFGQVKSLDRIEIQPERKRNGFIVKEFKRFRAGKIINENLTPNGRLIVGLYKDGKLRRVGVHILVYEAFIGSIEKDNIIHHIDFNRRNNHFSNLQQMNFKEHNNIHKHPAWNKGKTASIIAKKRLSRSRKLLYYPKFKETYDLWKQGYNIKTIAQKQNLCTRQIYSRLKQYKTYQQELFF